MKKRLDVTLVERGLASSREKAQSLILAGQVLVNDEPVTKAGAAVTDSQQIRLREEEHPYVSRGGLKLEAALVAFGIDPQGKIALDVGASTGGFTHVLLLRGIQRVHALDVGHNQMDWKIRSDARVKVYEGVNARHLDPALLGEKVDLIVVDVSFISLSKILPALIPVAHAQTDWITLVKPQFEVGREKVGKGGIVQSETDRQDCLARVKSDAESFGLSQVGLIDSPITGGKGNKEFLAHWRLGAISP
ncbi:MAG: TlyA family RNA methyltransferase [Bacteriovoracia bacterium]